MGRAPEEDRGRARAGCCAGQGAGVPVATACTPDRPDVTIINVARDVGAKTDRRRRQGRRRSRGSAHGPGFDDHQGAPRGGRHPGACGLEPSRGSARMTAAAEAHASAAAILVSSEASSGVGRRSAEARDAVSRPLGPVTLPVRRWAPCQSSSSETKPRASSCASTSLACFDTSSCRSPASSCSPVTAGRPIFERASKTSRKKRTLVCSPWSP